MTFDQWWHKVVMKDGTVLSNSFTERRKDDMRAGWDAALHFLPEGTFRMPRMMDYAEGLSPEAKAEFILELRETAAFYSSQRSAKCYQDPRTDSLEPQSETEPR